MERHFCPDCGNNTLTRVSTSIDSEGKTIYHLKEGYKVITRGSKYSLPMPKGGRNDNALILREDQKEYDKAVKRSQRAMKKAVSAERNVFEPEYMPTLYQSTKDRERLNRQAAMADVVIGYGRKNPNQVRRATGNK